MRPAETWEEEFQPKDLKFEMGWRKNDFKRLEKLCKKMTSGGRRPSRAVVVRAAVSALCDASEQG